MEHFINNIDGLDYDEIEFEEARFNESIGIDREQEQLNKILNQVLCD